MRIDADYRATDYYINTKKLVSDNANISDEQFDEFYVNYQTELLNKLQIKDFFQKEGIAPPPRHLVLDIKPEEMLRAQNQNKTDSSKKTQTLDEFKREVYDIINKMPVHPSQSKTKISINIADKAFEKMMSDPAYKREMMGVIQRDLGGAYPTAAAPSYSVIRIDDDCEYLADSMGSAYGNIFSGYQSTSFLQKNTKKASLDDDKFNQRKNQDRDLLYDTNDQAIAERKLAEKRLQEKLILDKDYEKMIQDKKLEQRDQHKKILNAYEKNITYI